MHQVMLRDKPLRRDREARHDYPATNAGKRGEPMDRDPLVLLKSGKVGSKA